MLMATRRFVLLVSLGLLCLPVACFAKVPVDPPIAMPESWGISEVIQFFGIVLLALWEMGRRDLLRRRVRK
jgi:hypothetical protein